MNFTQLLEETTANLINLPFKDVIDFAKNIDKNVEKAKTELLNEKKKIDDVLERLQRNYIKFGEVFTHPSLPLLPCSNEKKDNSIMRTIGGKNIKFPLIKKISDTRKFSGIPCCFKEVPGWFFIDFPTLNQILPVKASFSLFLSHLSSRSDERSERNERSEKYNEGTDCSKLNYNLFKNIPLDQLNTDFAIIPFTAETWRKFEDIPLSKWNNYLQQMNLNHYCLKKLPIYETVGMTDIAKTILPEQMGTEWSLFVQLYFLLYIFRYTAKPEHFTYLS